MEGVSHIPVTLCLCGLSLLCVSVSPWPRARAAADDRFAEIYNRSILKQRAVQSIRARFTETTTSTLLVKPIVAHGTVIAAAPARVKMTYSDPEPKTIAMDGRTLVVDWPQRRQRERIDVTEIQKRVDHYFRTASVEELRSMFAIVAEPDPAMPHTDRIDMRPKKKPITEGLERLELWIDRDSDLLTRLRMTFPGGDSKTIALEEIVLNPPIADDTFKP